MRTGPDTLTGQIRAILRASASASAPISTAEIRAQLIAADVEDDDSVYRRLSCMLLRGEVIASGEKPGKRYHMADGYAPPPRSPRNKKADGVPSLTQRVLDIVTAHPGVMFAQVRDQLQAQGVELREGQPSTCLSRLHDRGQIRSEGKAHVRRYFIGDVNAPAAAKAKKAAPATTEAAQPTAPVDASATQPEATDTPSRKDWHQSDDPITRLAASIEDHLTAAGTWSTAMQIAEDLDEDPDQITKAARRLVEAKRAEHRWIHDVREYGIGAPEAPLTLASVLQAHKVSEGGQPETGPLEDSHGPISSEPTPAAPPPAYCPAEVRFRPDLDAIAAAQTPEQKARVRMINDLLDVSDAALSEAPLLDSAKWLRGDIEDLVGRACDRNADHRAIKAMTTAAFALARAIQHLHTAGTMPASTGVTP